LAGDYELRITTSGGFGQKHTIKKFSILPKEIDIHLINNEIEFGSTIQINSKLAYGDNFSSFSFTFEDVTSIKTRVNIQDIIIKNTLGLDVTSNYIISNRIIEV